jgi:hypothetical protein
MNKYELSANQLLEQYNITVKTVRKSLSGIAFIEDKVISAPRPNQPLKFAIFAHEVGHIVNGHISPRWLEELSAWEFSIEQFKIFNFRIPKQVKSRMNYSLSFALAKALNRNMKQVPKELRKYKKFLSPITYIYGDGHKEQKQHADYAKCVLPRRLW